MLYRIDTYQRSPTKQRYHSTVIKTEGLYSSEYLIMNKKGEMEREEKREKY